MRWCWAFLFLCGSLSAASVTNASRLDNFYGQFVCETKDALAGAQITPFCDGTPSSHSRVSPINPPPPPPPPTNPIAPTAQKGYFPLVISNTSLQPDDTVYVLILGGLTQVYYLETEFYGKLVPLQVSTSTYTPSYSYTLTQLPRSTTGPNDYLVYLPNGTSSGRVYFSFGSPLFLLANANNTLTAPSSSSFYDPNYNLIYDFAEMTISEIANPTPSCITYQPFLDTTQVDNWSIPIKLFFAEYPSNAIYIPTDSPSTNPTGFSGSRETLLTTIVAGLPSPWSDLALPFYTDPYTSGGFTTYLRILAPKTGTTQTLPQPQSNYAVPQFPLTYLDSGSPSYLDNLFAYYASGGGNTIYIQAETSHGGSGATYAGTTSGTTFSFTSGSTTITMPKSGMTVSAMYSGVLPLTPAGADATLLSEYFGSAFVVGLVAVPGLYTASDSASVLNLANLQSHLPLVGGPAASPAYFNNTFGSAWYDIYSQQLHANAIFPTTPPYPGPASSLPDVGLCYAYDFDDTLNMSSTCSLPASTLISSQVYAEMQIGEVSVLPNTVFDDPSTYTLSFIFFTGSLSYRQGTSGSWIPVSSGASIVGVTTQSSNPFQIQYSGMVFSVYPKYQFMQPIGA